jgi:hypothetical protein
MLRPAVGSLALILALMGCTASADSQQRTVPESATTQPGDSQQRTVPESATTQPAETTAARPAKTSALAARRERYRKRVEHGQARCEYASVIPAYLPWLKRGEEVYPPHPFHGPDNSARFYWPRPGSRYNHGDYVKVSKSDSVFTTGPGQLVPGTRLPHTAEPGRLHSGDVFGWWPQAGITVSAIVWFLVGAPSCEWLTLQLSAPGMSREQAEEEIVRIAKSLQPL